MMKAARNIEACDDGAGQLRGISYIRERDLRQQVESFDGEEATAHIFTGPSREGDGYSTGTVGFELLVKPSQSDSNDQSIAVRLYSEYRYPDCSPERAYIYTEYPEVSATLGTAIVVADDAVLDDLDEDDQLDDEDIQDLVLELRPDLVELLTDVDLGEDEVDTLPTPAKEGFETIELYVPGEPDLRFEGRKVVEVWRQYMHPMLAESPRLYEATDGSYIMELDEGCQDTSEGFPSDETRVVVYSNREAFLKEADDGSSLGMNALALAEDAGYIEAD